MPSRCPLCGQPLPNAIKENELQSRIQKLASPALTVERKKLKEEFDERLEVAIEKTRQIAERQFQRELRTARESARIDAQRDLKKQVTDAERRAVRRTEQNSETKLEKLRSERERDKIRHAEESARFQRQLDELLRKLDKQSGERLGTEAELDLYKEITQAFPRDRIEKIGRGVKGADIVQGIVEGERVVGRIVYESKNTQTWNKEFITQAKSYQTQYETPHVMVVTRAFPPKYKGFCAVRDIPVIAPAMAVSLAKVIRQGIVEISKLRLSGNLSDAKSQELYEYIVGDKFCTRFREMAECVSSLREHQDKERDWHERAWQAESKIHERMGGRHREVDAQIRAIVSGSFGLESSKLPARPYTLRGATNIRQIEGVR